ncbi:MAG: hypothetical protein L3J02_02480 [Henriciella sp.]|nr:hypothetical protein [Henriciella sp.]
MFLAILAFSRAAPAQTIDRVKFVQAPMVIVWDGEAEPLAGAIVLVSDHASPGVPTYVQTGILEPVGASFGKAGTVSQKSFRVASNTAFVIRAQVIIKPGEADAPFHLRVAEIGVNAQAPGAVEPPGGLMLSDLATPRVIYRADRRTALRPGSTRSQAVEFIADWAASDAATEVTFTVFVPETHHR